jgi:hypothetical protein
MIMYGIDARQQRFPGEKPFAYQPLADAAEEFRWSSDQKAAIRDYNLQDIGI